jgi:hypothetical protein
MDATDRTPTNSELTASQSLFTLPKRVILRIRPRSDLEYEEDKFNEYVLAFLTHHNPEETHVRWWARHFMHLQLCSTSRSWHIMLDMNMNNFDSSNFDQLPHEIYRVERRQTGLSVATHP